MPDFRKPVISKTAIPRGTFVRFNYSALQNGAPERPARIWGGVPQQAHVGLPFTHAPLVGQVWDGASGGRLWVVLSDGTARCVSPRDCETLGTSDTVEQLAVLP